MAKQLGSQGPHTTNSFHRIVSRAPFIAGRSQRDLNRFVSKALPTMPLQCPNCQLEFQGRKQLAPHLRSCTSRFSFLPPQPPPAPPPARGPDRRATDHQPPQPHSEEDLDIQRLMESLLNPPTEEGEEADESAGQPNDNETIPEEDRSEAGWTWPADLPGFVVEPSTHETPDGISKSLFDGHGLSPDSLLDGVDSGEGIGWVRDAKGQMSDEIKMSVELLKILKDKDLQLFDQVMKWKFRCDTKFGHSFTGTDTLPTRSGVLKTLSDIYGHGCLMPQKRKVDLPNTGESANVIIEH